MADKIRAGVNWDDLRFVLALARHGGLSAAARALRVNHATVSRRIDAVESALGRMLFDRRADGYVPTADGRAAVDRAEAMEAAVLGIRDAIGSVDGPTGTVRITTVRSLADVVLAEMLAGLRRTAPGLTIELLTEMRVLSIAQRDADIALRLGRPKDSELVGSKVAEISYGYFASPKTIAAWSKGFAVPLVGYDTGSDYTAEFGWLQRHFPNLSYSFRSNSNLAQAAAARGGTGVALLPRYLGGSFKGIQSFQFGPVMPNRELWVLTRADLASVPRIRLVVDYLRDGLKHVAASLAA